jgi:hypothetical protein
MAFPTRRAGHLPNAALHVEPARQIPDGYGDMAVVVEIA